MTSAWSLVDFISSSQHLGNELELLFKDPFPLPHSALIHHSRQYVLRASFAFYPSFNWHKTYSDSESLFCRFNLHFSQTKDKRTANNCDTRMMYDGSAASFYPWPDNTNWSMKLLTTLGQLFILTLSLESIHLTQRIKLGRLLLTRLSHLVKCSLSMVKL